MTATSLINYSDYELCRSTHLFNGLGSIDKSETDPDQVNAVFDDVMSNADLTLGEKHLLSNGNVCLWAPHQHGTGPVGTIRLWKDHGKTKIGTSQPISIVDKSRLYPRFILVSNGKGYPVEFQYYSLSQTSEFNNNNNITDLVNRILNSICRRSLEGAVGISLAPNRDPTFRGVERNYFNPDQTIRSEVTLMEHINDPGGSRQAVVTEYGYSSRSFGHCQPIFYTECYEDSNGNHKVKFGHAHDPT